MDRQVKFSQHTEEVHRRTRIKNCNYYSIISILMAHRSQTKNKDWKHSKQSQLFSRSPAFSKGTWMRFNSVSKPAADRLPMCSTHLTEQWMHAAGPPLSGSSLLQGFDPWGSCCCCWLASTRTDHPVPAVGRVRLHNRLDSQNLGSVKTEQGFH